MYNKIIYDIFNRFNDNMAEIQGDKFATIIISKFVCLCVCENLKKQNHQKNCLSKFRAQTQCFPVFILRSKKQTNIM